MTSGIDIWNAAAGYAGTPVRHRGRKPGKALDCAGVVLCAARACGIDLKEPPRYGRDPDAGTVLTQLRECAAEAMTCDVHPGDLLAFADSYGKARHFAITDGHGLIVHAEGKVGRVVIHRLDGGMRATLHSAWRLRGVM